eukprot:2590022-Karenia_brevis.AAC.1
MLHVLSSPGIKCSLKCPFKSGCIDSEPLICWSNEVALSPSIEGHDRYLLSDCLPWPGYKRFVKPSQNIPTITHLYAQSHNLPMNMLSKSLGGAGFHGPIIHDKSGWRFLHPGEGASLFAIPRDIHLSPYFIESWERIGNSIPIILTMLGACRVQNVVHALQSIHKSHGQSPHGIINDGISPCNIHYEQQKVLNDCVTFPNPSAQEKTNHANPCCSDQVFIVLPTGKTTVSYTHLTLPTICSV